MSKKIYCIEYVMSENNGLPKNYVNIDDPSFWSCLEHPWNIGRWTYTEEYDDEEEFKNDLIHRIKNCDIITKIFIEERNVNDPPKYGHKIKI